MPLKTYQKKRRFTATPEPKGTVKKMRNGALQFVVHEHHASHLHYDVRLECDGVLKSWAVPKGPSMDPEEKRLAVSVEDHPLAYGKFHGTIPAGNYGAGKVRIWDKGNYFAAGEDPKSRQDNEAVIREGLRVGHFHLIFRGKKLKGEFILVQLKKSEKNWLLMKKRGAETPLKNALPPLSETVSAKKTSMPKVVKPMLATLIEKPFDKPGWLFEIKWDGYRAIAHIKNKKVTLRSRNGLSFNSQFATLLPSLKSIPGQAILDGEVIVADERGRSDFQQLQDYRKSRKGHLIYAVFDLLHLNGYDLRQLSLIDRKKLLKNLLPDLPNLIFSDHVEGEGKAFFKTALKHDLEGVIAKKASSPYRDGERGLDWLKIKNHQQQEAVIVGITAPRGGRTSFGALILGAYDRDELTYIGHTGTGFDDQALVEISALLKPLITKKCPFKVVPNTNAPVQWLKPRYVCEVRFANWTRDGVMRTPVFLGLREEKKPEEVTREQVQHAQSSENFTHLDKVYWPKEKYTKGDVIEYYRQVTKIMLPYLKDRPQILHRHPHGIAGESFYQKNNKDIPEGMKTVNIHSDSAGKNIEYLLCNDQKALLYMANLGCIEIHPWNSRVQDLDKPDYVIFDLDPLGIGFDRVVKIAQEFRKVLEQAGAKSYCKTSGATGLHVVVPLGGKYSTEQVTQFANIVVDIVHRLFPKITSIERMPSKRNKKVYLDYLQNRRGQSIVAPYSLRARPHAPVSTPLEWSEVKVGLDPKAFTMKTMLKRLKKKGDLWKKVLGKGIDMERVLRKLPRVD